ncbi:MAG: PQQ-binding-like beta-propeller repeat protein [Bacteroidaceae bacterium]|nr:PQQ-binding-like beta-propeller repeat protein [Bacteroidaceae bacterium]
MKKIIYHIPLLAVLLLVLVACKDEYSFSSAYDRYQAENLQATTGDESVSLKWNLQAGKPLPNDIYITWTAAAEGIEDGAMTVDSDVSEATITGLVNDIAYTFSVQGRYDGGLSGKVTASCTPKSTRIPVTDFKVMAGDKRVFVSWTAPQTSLIFKYQLDVLSGGSVVKTLEPESTAASYLVNDLTNGTEYTFRLTCVYGHGSSLSSEASATPGEVSPFSILPASPHVAELTQLDLNPAYFVAGTIANAVWTFADGSTEIGESITHCFTTTGEQNITLLVTYTSGTTESVTEKVTIQSFAWSTVSDVGYQKSSNVVFSPDGQTLYTVSQSTKVIYAINAITGEIKWQQTMDAATYGAGPVVGADGKVFLGTEDAAGTLTCFTTNGTVAWTASLGKAVKAAPAVTSDGVVYALVDGGTLYALDAATGNTKWSVVQSGNAGGVAVDADGNVYMGTNAGIWSYTSSGSLRWSCDKGHKVTERGGSLALADGLLYATLKSKGGVAAVNMADGKTQWTYATPQNDSYHPVVDKEGTVYFCEKNGGVYAVKKDGTLKWSYLTDVNYIYSGFALGADGYAYISQYASPFNLLKISSSGTVEVENAIGKQTMSAITIGPDGRIYYGLNGSIAAFNSGVQLLSGGWPMRGGNQQGSNSLK